MYCNGTSCDGGLYQTAGETVVFWVDLSQAGLIDGGFNAAAPNTFPSSNITGAALANWFPQAKIGQGNYIYVWNPNTFSGTGNSQNYFGLSAITSSNTNGPLYSSTGLSVAQAYGIDKKLDDGIPVTGRVIAQYVSLNGYPFSPTSQYGSSATCDDNGGVYGAAAQYSTAQSGSNNLNCAISFQFQ